MATIRSGQNVWDLIIQHYGDIEKAKSIISQFSDITSELVPFTEIDVEETNNNIARLFTINKTSVATYDHPLPDAMQWNNEDALQWNTLEEIEFNNV